MSMSAQSVWQSMGDGDQRAAVVDRIPRLGWVFRYMISGETKIQYIEFQDGDKWRPVGIAPKAWQVKAMHSKKGE